MLCQESLADVRPPLQRVAAKHNLKTLKGRLAWALERRQDATQADLARYVGVERASVSDWFTGATKSLDGKNLTKAAAFLHVDAHWLATNEGSWQVKEPTSNYGIAPILAWEHDHDLPPGDYIQIPSLEVQLSAGPGDEQRNLGLQLQIDFLEAEPLAFRADWIRKMRLQPSKLAAMRVGGDSMENRLHDGDAVVIDTSQTEILDGKVYALWYDGGERVKRIYRRPGGGLVIHSDNEAKYPPMTLSAEECQHIRIIGRVVHVSGEGGL